MYLSVTMCLVVVYLSHWVPFAYGRACTVVGARVSSECRVCVLFCLQSTVVPFCYSVPRPRFLVLFPTVATAPQPMLGTSRVRSYDRGPLETVSVASPKVPGLPGVGVMRDFPTTPLGQRWWKPRDTHAKLRHFTCDVPR